MNRYRCIIAYEGTNFAGWQLQPGQNVVTIVQVLQQSFERVFGCTIQIHGASRTDAGVHALGQVALVITPLTIDPKVLCLAWNNALPPTIRMQSIEVANEQFHPRRNVALKTYYYHFFTSDPLPFMHRYGWFVRYPICLEKLKASLEIFKGTHNFRSFCTGNVHDGDAVRTIEDIRIEYLPEYCAYRITIIAERFLRYMIRRMVGAAITIAMRDTLQPKLLQEILQAANPKNTLYTAPAQGLCLYKIQYKQGAR